MTEAPFVGRLLVGLNGQEPDVHLIRYASMVARLSPLPEQAPGRPDPEVRFVYLFPRAGTTPTADCAPSRSRLRAQVSTYFTAFSQNTGRARGDIEIGCDVLKGNVFERLSALAGDFDSDLLLLGQSTWSPTAGARMAMEAPCPVWLVPPAWAPVLRRLLVPCEFSERSAAAAQAAVNIARRSRNAKCLLLHVYWNGSRFAGAGNADIRQLREAYERFVASIDCHGVAVEPLFVEGSNVAQQIERAARRHGVDVVIMSTRGRTRSTRLLLPSTTDLAIRRCPASFLVLRASDRPVGLLQALRERLGTRQDPHFS